MVHTDWECIEDCMFAASAVALRLRGQSSSLSLVVFRPHKAIRICVGPFLGSSRTARQLGQILEK